eukprot:TRINITY_DN3427_c0_g1_i4.p1 TRINITY_DN3427_c0_g1~~TRINITY_DN3427_c0_g1_i4.p1  ORF type:complete len:606 (+),score=211.67 TRINITY_DN3427_c0_g1_i4:79-1896(+)
MISKACLTMRMPGGLRREKIDLNADINVSELRTSLQSNISKVHKRTASSSSDDKKKSKDAPITPMSMIGKQSRSSFHGLEKSPSASSSSSSSSSSHLVSKTSSSSSHTGVPVSLTPPSSPSSHPLVSSKSSPGSGLLRQSATPAPSSPGGSPTSSTFNPLRASMPVVSPSAKRSLLPTPSTKAEHPSSPLPSPGSRPSTPTSSSSPSSSAVPPPSPGSFTPTSPYPPVAVLPNATSRPPLFERTKGNSFETGVASLTPTMLTPDMLTITDPLKFEPWYSNYFTGKEHFNFIGEDPSLGPYIVSVIKITEKGEKDGMDRWRVLTRTKRADEKHIVAIKSAGSGLFSSKSKVPIKEILAEAMPNLVTKKINPLKDVDVTPDLRKFEDRQIIKSYKFGVLYCAAGQTDEEDMFGNKDGSPDFEEFLDFIGQRITLLGWPNYRAGLDVKYGSTGPASVYTNFREFELMYHVSTLLPYNPVEAQQVERKRHLGNDIVVIVFKEGNVPYSPETIKSEFNHVFAVVSKETVPNDPKTYYRLEIASRDGVPAFRPDLPSPCAFEKSDVFRDLLLTKLINGEVATYDAPAFKMKIQRTRLQLLKDIQKKINGEA